LEFGFWILDFFTGGFMTKNLLNKDISSGDWLEEEEYDGQLAVDAYQTDDAVVLQAPIAGVKPQDIEITITDEVVTIKGVRNQAQEIARENFFTQEVYWGAFARSYLLPVAVDADHAEATINDGVLTIRIPKQEKTKTRVIRVKQSE
jgi:HSP20 family protein